MWHLQYDPTPNITNKPADGVRWDDYVLATRWPDCDWNDPWAVGYVDMISEGRVCVENRWFRYAMKITGEQGERIIAEYPHREGQTFDPLVLARIIGLTSPVS